MPQIGAMIGLLPESPRGADMTRVNAVIMGGHWISALKCVSTPSTGAVQLLPEQKYTESVIVEVNEGWL